MTHALTSPVPPAAGADALDPGASAAPASAPPSEAKALDTHTDAPLEPEPEPPPAYQFNAPVDVRSLSLALLALFAGIAVLHWAAAVFIPVAVSVLLTSALSPLVTVLQRWHIPRWLGAAFLLLGIVGGLGATAWQLSDGASQVVESLPVAAKKVRDKLREQSGNKTPSTLETVQKAATQIEQAAAENAAPPATKRGVQRVQIESAPLNIRAYLWSGTMGLLSAVGQFTVVVFLTFFALASGDVFRRKLVRIAGPSLERKKVTVHVLNEISGQIQRYLLVQVLTSVIVGVATGLAYAALGLQNPAVWGVFAGVLNLVPYIGSIIVTGASALVAFLQFGTFDMALAVGSASLVIHTLVGNLLTPWLTSRTSSMSPVAVFVSVLAWGWLWGLWGLLLGIPIMMGVKAICDRVEDLNAVGELLGN
ncbi:AI-2E family transporter [Acidovorax sp. SRB_24]|uniref:AI-2E family transporter n=1 Tax=Acidovorax sp. SRB_24 TaxID=1962700 RepID=UPI00145FB415|nr:AI-2E family transporter [Acidovorax sp. SRB_24]